MNWSEIIGHVCLAVTTIAGFWFADRRNRRERRRRGRTNYSGPERRKHV